MKKLYIVREVWFDELSEDAGKKLMILLNDNFEKTLEINTDVRGCYSIHSVRDIKGDVLELKEKEMDRQWQNYVGSRQKLIKN